MLRLKACTTTARLNSFFILNLFFNPISFERSEVWHLPTPRSTLRYHCYWGAPTTDSFSCPSESSCFSITETSGQAVLCSEFPISTGTRRNWNTSRRTKLLGNYLCNWSSRKGGKGRNLKRSLIGLKHTEFLRNSMWCCEAFRASLFRGLNTGKHTKPQLQSLVRTKENFPGAVRASMQLQPLVGCANFHQRKPIRGLHRLPSGTLVLVLQMGRQRLLQTHPLLRTARLTQLQKPRVCALGISRRLGKGWGGGYDQAWTDS